MNFLQRQGNQVISVPPHANVTQPPKTPVKSKFSPQEDSKLLSLVLEHGSKNWLQISKLMGTRNPRQCRERWNNYINPDLRKDPWTPEEDKILEEKYAEIGPKWNKLARFLRNRSDNSIRNRWMMISRHRSITTRPKKSSPHSPRASVLGQLVLPNMGDIDSFKEPFLIEPELDFSFDDKGIDIWENFSFF